jgi:hypothetical protein
MESVTFRISLDEPTMRAMLGKLKRGQPVQIPARAFTDDSGMPISMSVSSDKMKKIARSMKQGRGVRIQLSPEERSTIGGIDFTQGGRVKTPKEINRDIRKAFVKLGEKAKKIPKFYRENVREYTQPIAKVLIQEGLPLLGEILVTEGLKAADVPAPAAKLAGKAAKAGLKKPSKQAFQKSGLGMKMMSTPDMMGGRMKPAVMPFEKETVLTSPPTEMRGRMPRNAGMGIRMKDVCVNDQMLPPIHYGGSVTMGRLMDSRSGSYSPFQTASTPMMPLGSGLYAGGRGLF